MNLEESIHGFVGKGTALLASAAEKEAAWLGPEEDHGYGRSLPVGFGRNGQPHEDAGRSEKAVSAMERRSPPGISEHDRRSHGTGSSP